jgi:hypothetical protein
VKYWSEVEDAAVVEWQALDAAGDITMRNDVYTRLIHPAFWHLTQVLRRSRFATAQFHRMTIDEAEADVLTFLYSVLPKYKQSAAGNAAGFSYFNMCATNRYRKLLAPLDGHDRHNKFMLAPAKDGNDDTDPINVIPDPAPLPDTVVEPWTLGWDDVDHRDNPELLELLGAARLVADGASGAVPVAVLWHWVADKLGITFKEVQERKHRLMRLNRLTPYVHRPGRDLREPRLGHCRRVEQVDAATGQVVNVWPSLSTAHTVGRMRWHGWDQQKPDKAGYLWKRL